MKNYYEVLGVEKNASQDEIKKAYRKAARECHPDHHPDDPEAETKFKEINEAYQTLSDESKRVQYDMMGSLGGMSSFNDIFKQYTSDVFNNMSRHHKRHIKGMDIHKTIHITLEDAYTDIKKEITVEKQPQCDHCQGTGLDDTTRETCTNCNGSGNVRYTQGFLMISQTCHTCHGLGYFTQKCTSCKGTGKEDTVETKKAMLTIPKGIPSGGILKILNEGESGINGGPAGDLYVHVKILPHDRFVREGDDLLYEMAVKYTDLVLGTEKTIQTFDDIINITIPPGTEVSEIITVPDAGMPYLTQKKKGDLRITLKLIVPQKLSKNQLKLLDALVKTGL